MPIVKKGRIYDYAADCFACGEVQVFLTPRERQRWIDEHQAQGHETDSYLHGRV